MRLHEFRRIRCIGVLTPGSWQFLVSAEVRHRHLFVSGSPLYATPMGKATGRHHHPRLPGQRAYCDHGRDLPLHRRQRPDSVGQGAPRCIPAHRCVQLFRWRQLCGVPQNCCIALAHSVGGATATPEGAPRRMYEMPRQGTLPIRRATKTLRLSGG